MYKQLYFACFVFIKVRLKAGYYLYNNYLTWQHRDYSLAQSKRKLILSTSFSRLVN
jgi:hypothetical protein